MRPIDYVICLRRHFSTHQLILQKNKLVAFLLVHLKAGQTDGGAGGLAAYGAHVVRGVHARLPHTRAHRTGA